MRLLGHLLRGASLRSGVQTEIIEIPLSEHPVAVACCPISGDLLVACETTLVLFTLRRQNQQSLVRIHLHLIHFNNVVDEGMVKRVLFLLQLKQQCFTGDICNVPQLFVSLMKTYTNICVCGLIHIC